MRLYVTTYCLKACPVKETWLIFKQNEKQTASGSGNLVPLLHRQWMTQEYAMHQLSVIHFLNILIGWTINSLYTVSQKKNGATFIFTVTLANVGRFLKFFQCRNQKELAHNKNEKFPTVS